jgi:hypothetical protein
MTLTTDLFTELGAVSGVLEWTASTDQFVRAITRAGTLGLDDASTEAVARWLVWEAAMVDLATKFDFTADKGTYRRSQMHDMVSKNVARFKALALPYVPSGAVIGELVREDPYAEAASADEFA